MLTHKPYIASLSTYLMFLKACAQGGVTCIQWRDKNPHLSEDDINFARRIQSLARRFDVKFIVNDRVDIAQELQADGVHLGANDLSPRDAKKRLGQKAVVGFSIENEAQLEKALYEKSFIDYVAASPTFSSTHKEHGTCWGLQGVKYLSKTIPRPLVSIGGINEKNALSVLEAGAQGLAVIGALHDARDPFKQSQILRSIVDSLQKNS